MVNNIFATKVSKSYDVFGRLKSTTWPSGLMAINHFNPDGSVNSITDANHNKLWHLLGQNQFGNPSRYELGNGLLTEKTFNPINGRLTDIASVIGTTPAQTLHYEWENNGNLSSRKDFLANKTESFEYDEFNRLTVCNLDGIEQLTTGYDGIGNIDYKSDVGTYKYEEPEKHPHAVTGVDNEIPSTISRLTQDAQYTSFDKIWELTETDEENDNFEVYELNINYGIDHERVWQKFVDNNTAQSKTKRFFGYTYEVVKDHLGNINKLHYLIGPSGIFAIFAIDSEEELTAHYILTDHLGSPTKLFDNNGGLLQKMNFDAWGRRRNAETWGYEGLENQFFLIDRGFTMHEHYNKIKLINMNGRMYDPVMGRFLSTDPLVQLPNNNQSYNRYTYALNNPLRFTDPSGFAFIENMDWFINNISGDVYYNSEYRKGDESKIEGNGWSHFAENGKLSLSGEQDFDVLWKNKSLGKFVEHKEYDSYTAINAKMISFTMEATFKGKNAEVFMNGQGYELVPSKVLVENHEIIYSSVETGPGSVSQTGGTIKTIGLSGTYAIKGYVPIVSKTKPIYYQIDYDFLTDTKTINEAFIDYYEYKPSLNPTSLLLKFIKFSEVSQGIHKKQKEINYNLSPIQR